MKKLVLLVFAMFFAVLANAQEKKEVVFSTEPEIHCDGCVNKIKNNIRFEKGVKAINADLKTKLVTIQYDSSKTDVEKLQKAFQKIGYKAIVVEPQNNEAVKTNNGKQQSSKEG